MVRQHAWRRSDTGRRGWGELYGIHGAAECNVSERLAPSARRCRALARHTLTLHEGMFLVSTVYNFCTPRESLDPARKMTPAMDAGLTDHGWTMHELLSFQVPLPRWAPPKRRGRPSQALQRQTERWWSWPRLTVERSV